jgi:hypothetical protein
VGQADAVQAGYRTTLAVPLLREDEAVGVILIRRLEVRPFTDKQIALLRTFADQAVIAIENVRLFKELEARNKDLSAALDRQTATADILRVISQAQTDVQPVFEAIADSAMRSSARGRWWCSDAMASSCDSPRQRRSAREQRSHHGEAWGAVVSPRRADGSDGADADGTADRGRRDGHVLGPCPPRECPRARLALDDSSADAAGGDVVGSSG